MRFFALLLIFTSICEGGVDLHSHLFLEHGVPKWFYKGCFTCPLEAEQYSDLRSTKVNEESLNQSKFDIVVASLHAVSYGPHPLRDSIRLQIQEAKNFISRNPQWILARSASEALNGIKNKKRILVLSLEGAAGVLETDEDIHEFVGAGPIAIVTPLHLTDDEFGGAAFMWSYHGLVNFFPYVKSLFQWNPMRIEGVRVNSMGLSERGDWLVSRLIGAKAWVDLAHASDRAQMAIISALAKAKQPLLYTHTVLREHHGAERGLAQWQSDEIQLRGGLVGLLPSRDYLNDTDDCDFKALFVQYKKLANKIGRDSVALGTDFNAPIRHLSAGCGIDDVSGFWNPAQVSELWKQLNHLQPGLVDSKAQVRQFLSLWGQVR